jgi:hypothetical protein
MDCKLVSFGRLEIDGKVFEHDVVIKGGRVRRRKKGPSKPQRAVYGHTPLTPDERIPWSAATLIVGTGADGRMPIAPALYEEAEHRHVRVVAVPTEEACRLLNEAGSGAAAVLHVTC